MQSGVEVTVSVGDDAADLPDPHRVYCLNPQHVLALSRAAVALGLAESSVPPDRVVFQPGSGASVPITMWRRDHPAEFRRACTALVGAAPAAQRPAGRSGEAGALPRWLEAASLTLLPILAGTVVTARSLRRQRRHDLGDQVQTAGVAFSDAVTTYLDNPADSAAATAVSTRRQALCRYLGRAVTLHPRSQLEPVLDDIRSGTGPLGRELNERPVLEGHAEASYRQRVTGALNELGTAVESLARELDPPPWRPWKRA